MLKIRTKVRAKMIFSLIAGPLLCVYILIPLLSALFLKCLPLVPKEHVLLAFTILGAMAVAASGFLMSLIISYFSISREIRTTLYGVLIASILIVVCSFIFLPVPPQVNRTHWLLKITLDTAINIVALLCFAIIGAWVYATIRKSVKQARQ